MRRDLDPKDNKSSTPPEEEEVYLRSVWIAECYPASRVRDLLEGLGRLGWLDDPSTPGRHIEQWLEDSRSSGDAFFWQNVGVIYPKTSGALGPALRGSLPDGVESVNFQLFGIGSDLTVATFQFNLNDEIRLDTPLRIVAETTAEPTGQPSRVRFSQPYHKKARALASVRLRLHNHLSGWVAERFPGTFASGIADAEFPSCDFITFATSVPCEEEREGMSDWRQLFGLTSDSGTWKSTYLGSAVLRFTDRWQAEGTRYRLELMANEAQFLDSLDTDLYGGRSIDGARSMMAMPMANLLALWAAHVLLVTWERQMGSIRDEFGDIRRSRPRSERDALSEARAAVQMLGYDIGLVASSLRRMAQEPVRLPNEMPDFREASSRLLDYYEQKGQEPQDLSDRLVHSIRFRARSVARTASSLREVVSLETVIAGSSVNLKLQQTLTTLTWVLVVLALTTVVLGILQFDLLSTRN